VNKQIYFIFYFKLFTPNKIVSQLWCCHLHNDQQFCKDYSKVCVIVYQGDNVEMKRKTWWAKKTKI